MVNEVDMEHGIWDSEDNESDEDRYEHYDNPTVALATAIVSTLCAA